jgi:hypothetical protein
VCGIVMGVRDRKRIRCARWDEMEVRRLCRKMGRRKGLGVVGGMNVGKGGGGGGN